MIVLLSLSMWTHHAMTLFTAKSVIWNYLWYMYHTLWVGLGYADVENRTKMSPDTVLRIASISKSITMAAVAKQWELGILDLDKPVQYYVPSFPEKQINGVKVRTN